MDVKTRVTATSVLMLLALVAGAQPAAHAAQHADANGAAFYLGGTCLCSTAPTAQQALGLADGYLSSAGPITGIGYPAGLLFALDSAIGASGVNAQLDATPRGVTITLAGTSQGAMVLNYVKQSLALRITPNRPATELSFVTFGDPMNSTGGIVTRNPLLWLSVPRGPLPTPYATTEIVREYDGFADWPSHPTALAAMNAVMGIALVHPDYGDVANTTTPGTLKSVSTNAAGGVTTHYLVPTADLPITQPLRAMGLNTTALDRWLRPQIDAAYDRRPAEPTSVSGATADTSSSTTASPTKPPTGADLPAAVTEAQSAERARPQISAVGRVRSALGLNTTPTAGRRTDERRPGRLSPLAAITRALTPRALRDSIGVGRDAEPRSTTTDSPSPTAAPDTQTANATPKRSTAGEPESHRTPDTQQRTGGHPAKTPPPGPRPTEKTPPVR